MGSAWSFHNVIETETELNRKDCPLGYKSEKHKMIVFHGVWDSTVTQSIRDLPINNPTRIDTGTPRGIADNLYDVNSTSD